MEFKMKIKIFAICMLCATAIFPDDTADTKKIEAGKTGVDVKIGWNTASTGGIIHITSWLAINPFIIYRSDERSNSANSGTYNYSTNEKYYGGGAVLPIYLARIENLYVKALPGFSYMKGSYSEKYFSSSSFGVSSYNSDRVTTRYTLQFFLGLQYAITKYLHAIAETGLNYSYSDYADTTGNNTQKLLNLYSGNIGLIFYFN